jgi:hypothetical protein
MVLDSTGGALGQSGIIATGEHDTIGVFASGEEFSVLRHAFNRLTVRDVTKNCCAQGRGE